MRCGGLLLSVLACSIQQIWGVPSGVPTLTPPWYLADPGNSCTQTCNKYGDPGQVCDDAVIAIHHTTTNTVAGFDAIITSSDPAIWETGAYAYNSQNNQPHCPYLAEAGSGLVWMKSGCKTSVMQPLLCNRASAGVYQRRLCYCGSGAAGASVGGDPITIYSGVEHKFTMPFSGELVPLLSARDFVLEASAFQGEADDEQWVGRAVVSSSAGEQVIEVKIKSGLSNFDKNTITFRDFETIEVNAPWLQEQPLTFPTNDNWVQWSKFIFAGHHVHPSGISFDIVRIVNPETMPAGTAQREGVLVTTESGQFMILSTSALEYYWGDDDNTRSLNYAHLDIDFIRLQNPSMLRGLLPKVWGTIPSNDTDITTNFTQKIMSRSELTTMVLESLLEPAALSCSGQECGN